MARIPPADAEAPGQIAAGDVETAAHLPHEVVGPETEDVPAEEPQIHAERGVSARRAGGEASGLEIEAAPRLQSVLPDLRLCAEARREHHARPGAVHHLVE